MIIFGLVCFVLGLLFGISILETLGVVLIVIGALLWAAHAVGHGVGGRHYW